ncbi:hypothetical protein F5Y06DRAFT_123437 [Hypoxylon sp. FL0890]|nr:hypothetical protein F5Y06DRAFT_123437 [Hypoxylon sp. FL0890]
MLLPAPSLWCSALNISGLFSKLLDPHSCLPGKYQVSRQRSPLTSKTQAATKTKAITMYCKFKGPFRVLVLACAAARSSQPHEDETWHLIGPGRPFRPLSHYRLSISPSRIERQFSSASHSHDPFKRAMALALSKTIVNPEAAWQGGLSKRRYRGAFFPFYSTRYLHTRRC